MYVCVYVCVCVCVLRLARKHDISRTVSWIHVILDIVIVYDPQMCPIVFGDDVTHINEGAGLNVKILKKAYFSSQLLNLFQIQLINVA